ncbi:MAG: class I SAM-dependent methyltransferase [Chlorobi bacterium]|nr:class I SAM-dependent methyltransferase [Chlorobiota bacterium]
MHAADDYYHLVRYDVVEYVPNYIRRLLDVGCGAGCTADYLKRVRGIETVIGIEYVPHAAAEAAQRLDCVHTGDIEQIELPYPDGYFDCILCADVLEHLRDPWNVLRRLRRLLTPDGVLIASIPNIRHVRVLAKIVFNRFEYEDSGILDQTHLRFFTRHTIEQLFTTTGYDVRFVGANRSRSWKFTLLNAVTFGLARPFSIVQYIVKARPEREVAQSTYTQTNHESCI